MYFKLIFLKLIYFILQLFITFFSDICIYMNDIGISMPQLILMVTTFMEHVHQ